MEIQTIYDEDIEYPYLLYKIYNRPKRIYVLGNKEILREKCFSIVGSRICSNYGKKSARRIAYDLAKRHIVIVSGLAKGIDTYAHLGALEANERTIAVLGSGFKNIYPKENIKLATEIIKKGGAVVSEYDINMKPLSENFPKRNRIISGLSSNIIVVEANRKSGSLITAQYAIEQGRNVWALPRKNIK